MSAIEILKVFVSMAGGLALFMFGMNALFKDKYEMLNITEGENGHMVDLSD